MAEWAHNPNNPPTNAPCVSGRAVAKTRVKRRTLAPEWGEIFIFEATAPRPKFATVEVKKGS